MKIFVGSIGAGKCCSGRPLSSGMAGRKIMVMFLYVWNDSPSIIVSIVVGKSFAFHLREKKKKT